MDLEKVLKQRIEELSAIGSDPAGGMTRLLYTDSWLAAQKYVQSQTEAFGLETQFDEVGNLFCRVAGTEFPQETILTGSHIDTVVNGGTLDGQYGVIASMTAVQYLLDKYGKPRRSLEVLSMAEEEGAGFQRFSGEAKMSSVKPNVKKWSTSLTTKAKSLLMRCTAKALIFGRSKQDVRTSKHLSKFILNKAIF